MYSPAYVTALASSRSVEISHFKSNRTNVVPNRLYYITISAIGDSGRRYYPERPIVVSKFLCVHAC